MQQSDDNGIKEALNKKAALGPDIDITKYADSQKQTVIDDLNNAPQEIKDDIIRVGVTADQAGRDGSILFIGNRPSSCTSCTQEGVVVMSTKQAIERYDWVREKFNWNVLDPKKDKYTAKTYLEDSDGYFVWVKEGVKAEKPVQCCMLIADQGTIQNVHNIIIVEKDASVELITGCTTDRHANNALHVGVSEMYVGENGSLTFSMIHNWGSDTAVRPRTAVRVEKGGSYVNNYVIMEPVGTLQSYPVAYLEGEGASARFNTICVSKTGSDIDTGGAVVFNAPNTSAEIMSRSITRGGRMIARGKLSGNAPGCKAHLECRSLVLEDGGLTLAIPELESTVADVELTHEAAVGKIARDQIEYLMSRGLSEDDAVSMIVRGFLVGGIQGLPENLEKEINDTIEKANLGN